MNDKFLDNLPSIRELKWETLLKNLNREDLERLCSYLKSITEDQEFLIDTAREYSERLKLKMKKAGIDTQVKW